MTPHELIQKLSDMQGPCMRFCAYCPEDVNTSEAKECVEEMYKEIYRLQADKDALFAEVLKLRREVAELSVWRELSDLGVSDAQVN